MRQREYAFAAKFYRYGWTDSSEYLLNGTDINKQITYGEYLDLYDFNSPWYEYREQDSGILISLRRQI